MQSLPRWRTAFFGCIVVIPYRTLWKNIRWIKIFFEATVSSISAHKYELSLKYLLKCSSRVRVKGRVKVTVRVRMRVRFRIRLRSDCSDYNLATLQNRCSKIWNWRFKRFRTGEKAGDTTASFPNSLLETGNIMAGEVIPAVQYNWFWGALNRDWITNVWHERKDAMFSTQMWAYNMSSMAFKSRQLLTTGFKLLPFVQTLLQTI